MTFLQAIILGIVQGATEFLPISSSAHLVFFPYVMGWKMAENQMFIFDVLVQLGTLLAVLVYFWKDLYAIGKAMLVGLGNRAPLGTFESRMGWLIVLATIPAGVAGLLVDGKIEQVFNSPHTTAYFLLGTAILLVLGEWIGNQVRSFESMTWKDALWIGFGQVLALFPGISRSGATISVALMKDVDRPSAARFSFLMAVPIMLAAGGLAFYKLLNLPTLDHLWPQYLAGFLASMVTGYISIKWLIQFLSHRSLYLFAVYCAALGLVILLMW